MTWNFTVAWEMTSWAAIPLVGLTAGEQAHHVELSASEEVLENDPVVDVGSGRDDVELPGGWGGASCSGMKSTDASLSSLERALSHSTNCRISDRWCLSERRREVVS